MEHFLEFAARDLFDNFLDRETGLSDITVVFPNRRARLFFDEYLSRCTDTPIWSPRYVTIEELFQSQSSLRVADHLQLVSLLYKSYVQVTHTDESLDSFWSWGELLLADFEDIDRNMANADSLFRMLSEQKEMDTDHTFLTQEQADAIHEFFAGLKNAGQTRIQQEYMSVWASLGGIYKLFRSTLLEMGLAYDGMLQRQVAECLDAGNFTSRQYAFIGFNGLDAAEKRLFQVLNQAGKALFYWDYDIAYTNDPNHESGLWLRENLKLFRNRLPEDLFDRLSKEKNITVIQAKTDSGQAAYIPEWIKGLECKPDRNCAIVLADNALLQSVLHSIPPGSTEAMNVTMGYPLTATPVFNLTASLIDMQLSAMKNSGRTRLEQICRVLDSPMLETVIPESSTLRERLVQDNVFYASLDMIARLAQNEMLRNVFRLCNGNLEFLDWLLELLTALTPAITDNPEDSMSRPLDQESLYRVYTCVTRMRSLIADGSMEIGTDTLCRLLLRILQGMSVPFHGEPVVGMQVMGLIETRNLDFENVLLLSATEGSLPGRGSQQSFIPYNLRVAFGLTTMKQKSAVTAYNFHHLLQRARNVTMIWNGDPDSTSQGSGQMSRYLLQLMTSGRKISRISLQPGLEGTDHTLPLFTKSQQVIDRLVRRYDTLTNPGAQFLSPSALNCYLECGVKFWFQYVAGLKERKDLQDDIDNALFGTLFHKSAQLAYDSLSQAGGGTISKDAIDALLKDGKRLESFVQRAFDIELFKAGDNSRHVDPSDYSGIQTINHEVILRYLTQILRMDRDLYAPFSYIAGEADGFSEYADIPCRSVPGGMVRVKMCGYIDRIDSRDGIVRIADYKTGREKKMPATVDELFIQGTSDRNSHVFQTFYYAMLASGHHSLQGCNLAPVLLYVRNTSKPAPEDLYMTMDKKPVQDFTNVQMPIFRQKLMELINGIFDPEVPFARTDDKKSCDLCPFKPLCPH